MSYQSIFKRREIKYLLTKEQRDYIEAGMSRYMKKDKFFHSSIRNIYFDTDSYRLIRRSLEKPVYKEKLRIRSYGQCEAGDDVFVELKKKYKSVVYKRRLQMPERDVIEWFSGNTGKRPDSQIGREIEYCRSYYGELKPAVFLSYERDSYASMGDDGLRITFDRDIMSRETDMSLEKETWGRRLIREDQVLMEIKTGPGLPLWMTNLLNETGSYKTSFSKYGEAYKQFLHPEMLEKYNLQPHEETDRKNINADASGRRCAKGGYKYA